MSVPTPTPRLVKKATRLELGGSKTCLRFDSKTSFSWKIATILSTSDTPDAKLLKILGETKLLFNSTSASIVSASFSLPSTDIPNTLRDLKSDKREIVIGVGEPNHIAIPITYHFEKLDGTKERRFLGHVFVIGPDLAREGYLKEFLPGVESIANTLLAKLRGPVENKNSTTRAAETPTDFFTMVSHEIRTPLYGIVGTTTLLGETIPLTAQQISYLSTLTSHSQHLLGMVNNILDFGKISSGKLVLSKTPTDIRTVLKTAATIIESRAASKNLTIVTDVAENIPSSLMLDSQRVTQILSNLLSNAVKFTEKGGVAVKIRGVELSLGGSPFASQTNSPVQAETKGLRVSTGKNSLVARFQGTRTQSDTILGVATTHFGVSKKPGDRSSLRVDPTDLKNKGSPPTTRKWRLDFSVEDTGVGISPEEIGNIKDVQRTDGSIGLGLSIVRYLVKTMGGEISVSSSGSGSTFSFFIFADADPAFGLGSALGQGSATGSKINFFAGPKNNDVTHISSPARPSLSPVGERFLSSKSAPGAVSSKKEKRPARGRKSDLKILIVEDDDVKAFTLQEMFFHLGYSPEKIQIVSGAGDDCVTEAERSRYDIIFMDSTTGAGEAIEKIRALPPRSRSRPAPKIVVLSHPGQEPKVSFGVVTEADRVLIKPVTKEKLASVMESFFGAR